MKMRFVLNDRVYHINSLDQVTQVLGLTDQDVEARTISALYWFTHKALIENIQRLYDLAASTTPKAVDNYQGSINLENQAFRAFLNAVERQYPTAPLLANDLIKQAKQGKISLDGKGIVLIVE